MAGVANNTLKRLKMRLPGLLDHAPNTWTLWLDLYNKGTQSYLDEHDANLKSSGLNLAHEMLCKYSGAFFDI